MNFLNEANYIFIPLDLVSSDLFWMKKKKNLRLICKKKRRKEKKEEEIDATVFTQWILTFWALDYKHLAVVFYKAEQLDSLNNGEDLPASTITFQMV